MAQPTIEEALTLPVLRAAQPRVLAAAWNLNRTIRWVHTTELPDIAEHLRGGELLLTTGVGLPQDESALQEFVVSLADIGVVGVVVEMGRRWKSDLPAVLVAAFESAGLPLVTLARDVSFSAVNQVVGEWIVDAQLSELREVEQVHDTFTRLSVAEAAPREILEAAQRLSGHVVVLEDQSGKVLDYVGSGAALDRVLPGWSALSRRVPFGSATTWDAPNGWLVAPVGRRDRGWGRLIITSPEQPTSVTFALIERAAAALAMFRLTDRDRANAVRRAHHELILGMINDGVTPDIERRCELAGFPMTRRKFVALSLRGTHSRSDGSTRRNTQADIANAVVHACHEAKIPSLVCELNSSVHVLLSMTMGTDVDSKVDQIAARVESSVPVVVGAGRAATTRESIAGSLTESEHVLQAIDDGSARQTVFRLADQHLRGLVMMMAHDPRLVAFASRELDLIRAHDRSSGEALLDVVRAVIDHPTSKTAAAKSLHLSRPTFYAKLERLAEMTGRDLDHGETRTSFHVALIIDGQQD